MTERMENALNHIKTSVDVDPWAIEVVEKVFKGVDDAVDEIWDKIDDGSHADEYISGFDDGLVEALDIIKEALDIINKHTGVSE